MTLSPAPEMDTAINLHFVIASEAWQSSSPVFPPLSGLPQSPRSFAMTVNGGTKLVEGLHFVRDVLEHKGRPFDKLMEREWVTKQSQSSLVRLHRNRDMLAAKNRLPILDLGNDDVVGRMCKFGGAGIIDRIVRPREQQRQSRMNGVQLFSGYF